MGRRGGWRGWFAGTLCLVVAAVGLSISGALAGFEPTHRTPVPPASASPSAAVLAAFGAAADSTPPAAPSATAEATATARPSPRASASATAAPTATPEPAPAGPAPSPAVPAAPQGPEAGKTTRGAPARPAVGSFRIGLQVGHWRNWEAPAPFNNNSGSSGGGKTEAEVNLAMAQATAALLRERGYIVDVLPTWFTAGYRADAFVAIHCDGGVSSKRGFFADRPASSATAARDARLVQLINEEHAAATGIPYVYRGTANTRYYYGFTRLQSQTPRAIVETGFLTNAEDRAVLIDQPQVVAEGLARALTRFLEGG